MPCDPTGTRENGKLGGYSPHGAWQKPPQPCRLRWEVFHRAVPGPPICPRPEAPQTFYLEPPPTPLPLSIHSVLGIGSLPGRPLRKASAVACRWVARPQPTRPHTAGPGRTPRAFKSHLIIVPARVGLCEEKVADLIQYINGTNMSVKHLADVLSEKTGSSSWVVVFKALVTVHHLMVHGNERFIQHLASRNSLFTLHNFLDKSVVEGYAMSTFIRRYSRYLNEKSLAYRLIASDITKTKRGMDGLMRTMNTKELLNTLPVIQTQFDALLNFNANPDELTNGIIHAAFMLLFKDSLRLFAAYNEGILNLLGKYFDMRKNQCKESLDIYMKFLGRMTKLAQFLKVAEQVGVDQKDIPYLTQAPCSLLEALKQHLASLEEKNDILPPYRLQHTLIPSIPNSPVVKASASRGWFEVEVCTTSSLGAIFYACQLGC
nr:phosphatidylinositol-binding clathrin assembly protein-like [Camelus bactrianus]